MSWVTDLLYSHIYDADTRATAERLYKQSRRGKTSAQRRRMDNEDLDRAERREEQRERRIAEARLYD